jgi:hypothetical protein
MLVNFGISTRNSKTFKNPIEPEEKVFFFGVKFPFELQKYSNEKLFPGIGRVRPKSDFMPSVNFIKLFLNCQL